MMNVFILSTGRCGSTTFERACRHIKNYTVSHESGVHQLGESRLACKDWHIESDNRLSWFLGRLDQKYGDGAFYVHLLRNHEEVSIGAEGGKERALKEFDRRHNAHDRRVRPQVPWDSFMTVSKAAIAKRRRAVRKMPGVIKNA